MNKYPQYIEVNNKRYKLNTDFRVALRCDEIIRDEEITNYEKAKAIIYLLTGDEGYSDIENQEKILKLLVKYLKCGKEYEQEDNKQPSMSFTQDEGYIKASFMSDYHIDLDKDTLHWWEFYDDLIGLKDSCILNRVRRIREEPLKGKKGEELHRWQEAKKAVALKVEKTKREKELDEYWEHLLNQKGE